MTQAGITIRALYDEDQTGPLSAVVGTTACAILVAAEPPLRSSLTSNSGILHPMFPVIRPSKLQRPMNLAGPYQQILTTLFH